MPHERLVLEALREGHVPPFVERGHDQRLTLVAARGSNGAIGVHGGMPWHLPEDLAHFKAVTMGGVMIMGRRTWDSIGRALPGRTTIVVTSDREWSAPGALVVHDLHEAISVAGPGEVFVAGGGEIYRQTIALASRLELTEVDAAVDGYGQAAYAPGIFKKGVEVPADASRQEQVLARTGRTVRADHR